jgi:hypothetical protein
MVGFNIDNFKASINGFGGILRNNKFLVVIPTPQVLLTPVNRANVNRTLEYWCESVNFPGYMLASHDVRRYTYGPIEKRPFSPNFTQLQCLFMNDNENNVWNFFHEWTDAILPHNTSDSINTTNQRGMAPYEIEYKINYLTDIHIYVYDETGKERIHIVCKEAFPSSIVEVPLSWADTNNNFRFQVSFEYQDWYLEPSPHQQQPLPTQV